MGAERVDYYSNEEFQQAEQMEIDQYQRLLEEEEAERQQAEEMERWGDDYPAEESDPLEGQFDPDDLPF